MADSRMNIESTINLGNLIQIGLLLVGFGKLYGDFREIKLKVNAMWAVFMRQHGERKSDKELEP